MLIKIGKDYIDPAEIAAAQYDPADNLDPDRYFVTLRSGGDVCLYCSPEELEAALMSSGMLAGEDMNVPGIPEEELPALLQLADEGYHFLARDGDGKIFAYRHAPELDGVYWTPVSPLDDEVKRLSREDFGFVAADDKKPFDIGQALP